MTVMRTVHMGKASLSVDLSDGSERGEYVNQDYILQTIGRPHRAVNLMYTYYPKDKEWPARISEACKDRKVTFAWDYPYDDYFPYGVNDEPFRFMRDIRRHGQDVTLTLTIDCSLDDEPLREIARQLRPYGRMRIRINHECVGDWFTHNKRFSFREIADFFVRFSGIIHEEAPNVKTIFCAGVSKEEGGPVEEEESMLPAYLAADVWSADKYLALHFGWPYDDTEEAIGNRSFASSVEETYRGFQYTAKRIRSITGQDKPLVLSELNVDGDVVGALHQGEVLKRFYEKIRDERPDWLEAVTLYQFRDRGRLGLEIEDPNNAQIGIPQPMLADYRETIQDPYFCPPMTAGEETAFPAKLRWGGAEDADGLELLLHLAHRPEFLELTFEEPLSLMIECNGRWFYKAPETKCVDLMGAFTGKEADGADLPVRIFATPPEGVNPDDGSGDWMVNYRTVMKEMPKLRVRFTPVGEVN
ncbi:MAG: hypothetical protein K5696_04805 [Lachnospiraceae bacterium]|nr:hypothetical protein [Lachnospiraceae bacterium]